MLQQGTFFKHVTYIHRPQATGHSQLSRLARRWIGRTVKHHYVVLLFLVTLPIMLSRIKDNPRAVIWSDAEGYYQYLPALFILKDFHHVPPGSVWPYYNDKGEYVIKYTCGIALFEWSFFLAAYAGSPIFGYDAMDYFNPLYCRAMAFSGLLFAFLGLFYLRKALLKVASPFHTFLVVVTVFAGTNLFHYATKEMSVAHVYNFFLFAVLLYKLPVYLKNPNARQSIILGLLIGWIVLIRPTNIIIALLLLLYDVYSWSELKERLIFFKKNISSVLMMLSASIIPLLPQLFYWKEMTGDWIYYAYTSEGFTNWRQPKIAAVLFDVQNGLFLYSPLVLLMIVGAVYGWRVKKFQGPASLIIFALITYVFASWWAWWFGGAFGHRCYVEYYALLAFPLAGLYQWVSSRKSLLLRVGFYSVVFVFTFLSVRLSYLYTSLGGPWDGPDWRWNWEMYLWILREVV